MRLSTFSFGSSIALHLLLALILALWMQAFHNDREIIFSNVTLLGDGAVMGSAPVLAPKAPVATPKAPVPTPAKASKPAEKTKAPAEPIQNKAPDAPLKATEKNTDPHPSAAEPTKAPVDPSPPAADSNGADSNVQPGGSQTMVGPVFVRAIRTSQYPEYPAWAQEQGIQTEVVCKFFVDAAGNVVDIDIEKVSGYSRIDYLCRKALKQWKFDPLPGDANDGKRQWGKILFKFRLQ